MSAMDWRRPYDLQRDSMALGYVEVSKLKSISSKQDSVNIPNRDIQSESAFELSGVDVLSTAATSSK